MICILIWYLFLIKLIYSIEIIKGSKILLSSNMNFSIPKNKCREISIPNNFKKIKLYLLSNEIDELLLTDHRIISCESKSISNCCNRNSTFCINDINPSNNYYHLYNCLEFSYIYACGNNNQNISSLVNIKIYNIKEEGCQIEELNKEIECANLGLSECKNQKKKNKKCQYIECFSENDEKLMELCLPSGLTDDEINEKCSNHADYGENGKYSKSNL